jgi:hypothetical protein
MAKAKAKAKKQQKEASDGTDFDTEKLENELPEGFARANPIDESPLYWKPDVGLTLQGELVGRFQRNDQDDDGKQAWYYQIRLTEPAMVRDADKQEREAEPGEVVNVDERSGLSHLAKYVGMPDKRWEVYIKAKEKVQQRRNASRSFWRFILGAKEIRG